MNQFIKSLALCALSFGAISAAGAPLSGIHTIGSGGDYETFSAAVEALKNSGVDGPVTFMVADGDYYETIRIPEIAGMSEENAVTFLGEGGARLYYDKYDGPAFYNSNYADVWGVVTIDGADDITFDGINFEVTEDGPLNLIKLQSGSERFTLRNATMTAPYYDMWDALEKTAVFLYSDTGDTVANNGLTIDNVVFKSGNYGIYGFSYADGLVAQGMRISNCTFDNSWSAIEPAAVKNAEIEGNVFLNNQYAVYTTNLSGNYRICGNRMTSTRANDTDFLRLGAYGENNGLIANNVVDIRCPGDWDKGFFMTIYGITGALTVAHNTVNIESNNSMSSLMKFDCGTYYLNLNNIVVENNLFRMNGKGIGYYAYAYYTRYTRPDKEVSFDAIHDAGSVMGNNIYAFSDGIEFAKESRTYDKKNSQYKPDHNEVFTADEFAVKMEEKSEVLTDIEWQEGSLKPVDATLVIGKGLPIAGVTTDFEGNPRNCETPSIGAFEFEMPRPLTLPALLVNDMEYSDSVLSFKDESVIVKFLLDEEISLWYRFIPANAAPGDIIAPLADADADTPLEGYQLYDHSNPVKIESHGILSYYVTDGVRRSDVREVSFSVNTGIESILTDEDSCREIYSVSGVRVDDAVNIESGVYIVRSNGKTYKIYVK